MTILVTNAICSLERDSARDHEQTLFGLLGVEFRVMVSVYFEDSAAQLKPMMKAFSVQNMGRLNFIIVARIQLHQMQSPPT